MNERLPNELHSIISKPRNCDGCGVQLQFFEDKALGFVDYQVYKTFVENELDFEQNKTKALEHLVQDKVLLNKHAKLPSKRELKVTDR